MNLHPKNNEVKVKAEKFRKENAYQMAVKEYLKALLLEKNDYEIYFGLGICYKFLNKT